MPTSSQLYRLAVGLGAVSGAVGISIFCYYNGHRDSASPLQVHNSWTTNYMPSVRWDHNWDR